MAGPRISVALVIPDGAADHAAALMDLLEAMPVVLGDVVDNGVSLSAELQIDDAWEGGVVFEWLAGWFDPDAGATGTLDIHICPHAPDTTEGLPCSPPAVYVPGDDPQQAQLQSVGDAQQAGIEVA